MNKPIFYYLRDKYNRPLITVCIIRVDSKYYARGVAICSLKDNPNKKIGRAIAEGRARKALTYYLGSQRAAARNPIVRHEAFESLEQTQAAYPYVSFLYNKSYFGSEYPVEESFIFNPERKELCGFEVPLSSVSEGSITSID